MFHSIRWRLVASYVILTLVTVSLVGLLALEMVRRYVQQRESADLEANAQVVARQALPLMEPALRSAELAQLVQTASFLGNVRVRILDAQGNPLVDSGQPSDDSELVWILPPSGEGVSSHDGLLPLNMMMLPGSAARQSGFESSHLQGFPPGTSLTIIRRTYSPWGSRFYFESPHTAGSVANENQPAQTGSGPANEVVTTTRSTSLVTEPIGGQRQPVGYVELSAGLNYGAEALATTRRALLFVGSGAALLAGIIGLLVSQRLTSPLLSLSGTANLMGAGDLSVRSSLQSRDEIGTLANQFNQMAARLEASFQQLAAERDALRRFVADASHELRTPITALKNFISLLQGPAEGDQQAQTEFLAESQVQINRLEWITHNLLDLSRMDAGLVELDAAEHPLGEMIEAAVAPFKAVAAERNIRLQLQLPEPSLNLCCDRGWVEIILSNLIDNAVKYTSSGGLVEIGGGLDEAGDELAEISVGLAEVDSGHQEEGIRIWVRDTGPGISSEDLPHIFERFYRGRHQTTSGSGLGLSIVHSMVQAQGGRVQVASQPGEGTCFTLEFPKRFCS